MALRAAAVVRFAMLIAVALGVAAVGGAGAERSQPRAQVAAADEPARDIEIPNPGERGTGSSATTSSTSTTLHGTPLPPSGINKIPEKMPTEEAP